MTSTGSSLSSTLSQGQRHVPTRDERVGWREAHVQGSGHGQVAPVPKHDFQALRLPIRGAGASTVPDPNLVALAADAVGRPDVTVGDEGYARCAGAGGGEGLSPCQVGPPRYVDTLGDGGGEFRHVVGRCGRGGLLEIKAGERLGKDMNVRTEQNRLYTNCDPPHRSNTLYT